MREYTQHEADELDARLTAKADRRQDWADGRREKAEAAATTSRNAVAGIPFGQPIIEGHHSAKRHRSALKRSRNAADRMLEHSKMAEHHQGKADRANARAVEVQRRAKGPKYTKADLVKGDRIAERNAAETFTGVVVRASAKSVTVQSVYPARFDASAESLRFMFYESHTLRMPSLKITSAWHQVDGQWTVVQGTGPGSSDHQ